MRPFSAQKDQLLTSALTQWPAYPRNLRIWTKSYHHTKMQPGGGVLHPLDRPHDHLGPSTGANDPGPSVRDFCSSKLHPSLLALCPLHFLYTYFHWHSILFPNVQAVSSLTVDLGASYQPCSPANANSPEIITAAAVAAGGAAPKRPIKN